MFEVAFEGVLFTEISLLPFQRRFLPFLGLGGKKHIFHSPSTELHKLETLQGPVSDFHCGVAEICALCGVHIGLFSNDRAQKNFSSRAKKTWKIFTCDGLNVTIDSKWLKAG